VPRRPGRADSSLARGPELTGLGRADGQRPESGKGSASRGQAGRDVQVLAWRWALVNRAGDGSLPSGRDIGRQHGRHERWGRLVKHAGLAGELDTQT